MSFIELFFKGELSPFKIWATLIILIRKGIMNRLRRWKMPY
ncbi:hypothetical protein [Clostridium sp. BNL1100]|nr:hypothetical protein [Clostridium sp. BNL1100]AEY65643.1 hypothetical protein Clo1100_1408 [Clostridium sp. BNL1100]